MKLADRLKQTTNATNTATVQLGAAPAGFRTLAQAIADGDITAGDTGVFFVIEDDAGNVEGSYFTVDSSTTLTRESVVFSSNNNAAVTFPAGSKTIFNSVPAEYLRGTPVASLPSLTLTDGDQVLAFRPSTGTLGFILASALGGAVPPTDTTAPTLTSATGSSTGTTTASGSVSTNEANGTLYFVATANATESAATVKAGGSQAVTATGVQNVTRSGLAAATAYRMHFLHRDAAGYDSAVVSSAQFTTASAGDTAEPTLSSPTGTQTGQTTASGSVSTNEANGTLYRYISANATETAATVKAANLTQAVTATGVQNVTFTGLAASTPYYAHYVHRDAAGNDSAVASSAQFTTAEAAPPATMAEQYAVTSGTTVPATTDTFDGGTDPNRYFNATFNLYVKDTSQNYPAADALTFFWLRTPTTDAPTVLPVALQHSGSAWPTAVPYAANGGTTGNVPNSVKASVYTNAGSFPGLFGPNAVLYGGGDDGYYRMIVGYSDGSWDASPYVVTVGTP